MSRKNTPLHVRRHVRFEELGALLAVREMLDRGLFPHAACVGASPNSNLDEPARRFRMLEAFKNDGCKTISCIGGTMALVMRFKTDESKRNYVGTSDGDGFRSNSLQTLFYPPRSMNWDRITPRVAVRAIDNWLATGRPNWKKALG